MKEKIAQPHRDAIHSDEIYDPREHAFRRVIAQDLAASAVRLSSLQIRTALMAMVSDINTMHLTAAILAIGTWHVHLVAQFEGLPIRQSVGRWKSVATRAMKEADTTFDPKRSWAKGCHMESLRDADSLDGACRYVGKHLTEGAALFAWPGYDYAIPAT